MTCHVLYITCSLKSSRRGRHYLVMFKYARGEACFYFSAFIQRRTRVCCLQHIALIRRMHCPKHWLQLIWQVNLKKNSKAHTSIMPRGAFSILMDPADAIRAHEVYQMAAMALWFCCDSGCLTGVTHFKFEVEGSHCFLLPYLTLRFLTPRRSLVSKNARWGMATRSNDFLLTQGDLVCLVSGVLRSPYWSPFRWVGSWRKTPTDLSPSE